MHQRITTAAFVAGTGLVTWALSERAFWGRLRPDDGVLDSAFTLAVYVAVAYLALLLVRRFDVREPRRLVLVGAALGWLLEGGIVATLYEALPLSIAWTGLAWHALISVVLGWHVLPRALAAGGRRAATATLALGVALGLWSAFMATDGKVPVDAREAAVSAAIATVALALGYGLMAVARPGPAALVRGRTAIVVGAAVALWACVLVVPAVPFAPVVLAPLLWLVVRALRRTRPAGSASDAGTALAAALPGVPPARLAPLAAVPALAAGAAALAGAIGHAEVIGYTSYAVLVPGGAVAFARAAGARLPRRLRRGRRRAEATA